MGIVGHMVSMYARATIVRHVRTRKEDTKWRLH